MFYWYNFDLEHSSCGQYFFTLHNLINLKFLHCNNPSRSPFSSYVIATATHGVNMAKSNKWTQLREVKSWLVDQLFLLVAIDRGQMQFTLNSAVFIRGNGVAFGRNNGNTLK